MGIVVTGMIRFFSWLLPWLFRRLYPPQKLADLIEVSVASENEGLSVNCGFPPSARVWLNITNLSPFNIKLIGMEAELIWAGQVGKFISLQRVKIVSSTKCNLHVSTDIGSSRAEHIKLHNKKEEPRLVLRLYFESRLHDFDKMRDICVGNFRLINGEVVLLEEK